MRVLPVCCGLAVCCLALQGSIFLPVVHLDNSALKAFSDYVAVFEGKGPAQFNSGGKLWIDGNGTRKSEFESGIPLVESRENKDVTGGSIHHYSGAIRVPGGKIEMIRKVMQDYPNYPKYFRPDVGSGEGKVQPDSTPEDEHYATRLLLTQSTIWMDVTYDSSYDTHYRRLDQNRWTVRSTVVSMKELLNPKDAAKGTYPEGDDHGFLWRTNTYWFVRERDGGLDLQVDSMSLSRKVPLGFGWWGTKRTHDAVDKMLRDTKAAIEAIK